MFMLLFSNGLCGNFKKVLDMNSLAVLLVLS